MRVVNEFLSLWFPRFHAFRLRSERHVSVDIEVLDLITYALTGKLVTARLKPVVGSLFNHRSLQRLFLLRRRMGDDVVANINLAHDCPLRNAVTNQREEPLRRHGEVKLLGQFKARCGALIVTAQVYCAQIDKFNGLRPIRNAWS